MTQKKKDAYYFSHDSSASRDIKMMKLKHKFGHEGFGYYWNILEILRETSDFSWEIDSNSLELLANLMAVPSERLSTILDTLITLELFVITDQKLHSHSFNQRMYEMNEKRSAGHRNGLLGGRPPKEKVNETQTKGNPKGKLKVTLKVNETIKGKESKYESKEKKEKVAIASAFFCLDTDCSKMTELEYFEFIETNSSQFSEIVWKKIAQGRKIAEPRFDVPNPFNWAYSIHNGLPSPNVPTETELKAKIAKSAINGGL